MTRHLDEGLLNDFREGLLEPREEGRVRAHLEDCPQCRKELQGLSTLAEQLGGLPKEAQPVRDLWPQISWRIEGLGTDIQPRLGADEGGKEDRPSGRIPTRRRGRWVSIPAWQLLAASIALMVVSGASVWAFLRDGPAAMGPPGETTHAAPAYFVDWEEAYGGYDEAVADLEDVLERGREILDPETVRVLEESLLAIDTAIEQAGEAVRQDPASPVLQRFLAENLRKKMDLLRKAAMAVYANT